MKVRITLTPRVRAALADLADAGLDFVAAQARAHQRSAAEGLRRNLPPPPVPPLSPDELVDAAARTVREVAREASRSTSSSKASRSTSSSRPVAARVEVSTSSSPGGEVVDAELVE